MLAINAFDSPAFWAHPSCCPSTDHFVDLGSFTLSDGTVIDKPRVALRDTGNRSGPAVLILGGISALRHVDGDEAGGWWERIVGAGKAVDTTQQRILSVDYLGAGDSTHPPAADAWQLTPFDQARIIERALRAHGVHSLAGVIGCSYGGLVALALGERSPDFANTLCVLCASHRPAVRTTAYRSVQRDIVRLGLENGHPRQGVELARRLAMIGFRTGEELDARFPSLGIADDEARQTRSNVQSYLAAKGDFYGSTVSPETFLCLSQSCDLGQIHPESVRCPVWLAAAETDEIVPVEHVRELASRLPKCLSLRTVYSRTGHDAFLTEEGFVCEILSSFSSGSLKEVCS